MLRLNIYSIPISGTFKSATLAGLFVRAHCTKVFNHPGMKKKVSFSKVHTTISHIFECTTNTSCSVHVQAQYVSATMPVAIS